MAKMSDVAKKAGVSVATVSRALCKPETVKPETRKKVQVAIQELNYKPNMLARQFRTNETKTIMVVVPDIANPFFSRVLRGIESVAHKKGYQVLLGDTSNNIDQEQRYLEILKQRLADGMILLTARMDKDSLLEISQDYPVVLACEYIEGSDIPIVSIDNISSARKVTEHLIKLGHTRIAHITGPTNVILSRDRFKGYKQALETNDLSYEDVLVQEGDFTYESGFNQMSKLLALNNRPSAVFAANDEMAIGAIKAVKLQGLKVPEDIAIVGFDNIKVSSIFEPALTTISQPKFEMGNVAMELLLKILDGQEVKRKQFVLADELIIRESCGGKVNSTI